MTNGMAVLQPGAPAPDFTLPAADGTLISLAEKRGTGGTVIAFICNHCPYVIAVAEKLTQLANDLEAVNVGMVAVMSNDWRAYPQDSPERMAEFAARYEFPFPYVIDESQDIAKAYGAKCTPDFFGFDGNLNLVYRGRMDASGSRAGQESLPRELHDAMVSVAEGGSAPDRQNPSAGCSIKWRG